MSRPIVRFWHVCAAALAVTASTSSHAGQIEHTPLEDGIELIVIGGDLKAGDEDKFRKLSVQYDKAIVALASNGGAMVPAIEIGKMIRIREFATVVLDGDMCISACALVWIAGHKRFLSPKGKIGFHASYIDEGGRKVETGLGNALVGRYLTLLNLPEKAVLFATAAPPDRVLWLTADNMDEAGIDFESFGQVATPPPLVRTPLASGSTAHSASNSGWQLVASSGTADHYLDTRNVRKSGQYLTAWMRVDPRDNTHLKYAESKDLWYFNCAARKSALKAFATFNKDGRVVDSHEYPDWELEWSTVMPDSVGESKLEAVCGNN